MVARWEKHLVGVLAVRSAENWVAWLDLKMVGHLAQKLAASMVVWRVV